MMPVVNAAGTVGPCLFVFKGKRIPFRQVLINESFETETYKDMLPRESLPSGKKVDESTVPISIHGRRNSWKMYMISRLVIALSL